MTRSGCREQGPQLPFSFDASTREVKVPITADKGKQLKLVFSFPDATSPHKLGLAKISVNWRSALRQFALGHRTKATCAA